MYVLVLTERVFELHSAVSGFKSKGGRGKINNQPFSPNPSMDLHAMYLYTTASMYRIVKNRTEMEFKEFEPRSKSAKPRFKLSAGINLVTFDTILSGTNHI